MQEIILIQDAQIECNFEQAKALLEEQIAPYRDVVFTEDTKKDAKETVAQLRKEQKDYDTAVKNLKKDYMKPFDNFYSQAKELIAMYDEPIKRINEQIEAFELKRKQEKQEQIQDFYNELVEEEWREIIPLSKIYNPKWENATASQKSIKEEILQRKTDAKSALETIRGFHSDMEERAINMYKNSLDVTEVVTFLTGYENQKREILEKEREQARQEETERIRAEERAKIQEEQKQAEAIEQAREEAKEETVSMFIPAETEEEPQFYSYSIKLTSASKEALEMYMDSVGIEYDEICF